MRRSHTPEFHAWQGMNQRCANPKTKSYARYGGRGITVCERWRASFDNFFADMGLRPSDQHSLDRRDNDGNYEPANCRWATPAEQNANRSDNVMFELDGKRQTMADWARDVGISKEAMHFRLASDDWTLRDALTVGPRPVRGSAHKHAKLTLEQVKEIRRRRAEGEKLTSLATAYGVSPSLVSKIAKGKNWGWAK